MNGTDATKQQLLDILAKVRENRSLTVEEVLMVCIARFAHIVPNESNKKFLYSLFIEKTEIGGRQVDALDYRVFNERTLARIPDRYFVPKRLGANSNIIETTDTDALLPAI
jgi:hypothetical protein